MFQSIEPQKSTKDTYHKPEQDSKPSEIDYSETLAGFGRAINSGPDTTPAQLMVKSEEEKPKQKKPEEELKQGKLAQRKPEEEPKQGKSEEEGQLRAKTAQQKPLEGGFLQRKTAQRKPEEELKQGKPKEEGQLRAKTAQQKPLEGGFLQRKTAQRKPEEELKQGKLAQKQEEDELQAKTNGESTGQSNGSSGSQTQMPEAVQSKMENSFGTSFSGVNIQKDSGSATEAGAKAYAQGENIHFAPGEYNPNTQSGQELLGHELTHVVQQRAGRVKPDAQQGKGGMNINSDKSLENEADTMGAKAAQGKDASMVSGKGSGVQRKTKQEVVNGIAKYDKYIESASETYGISVNQIKALISVESAGNPNATSGAAWGLMQITKSTWKGAQKNHTELSSYDFDTYWKNPKVNITFGAAIFKGKMKTVGVDASNENFASLAITAYNAGEGTVKKAIKNAKDAGSKNPTKDCLKPEYLKPAIEHYGIYSYYLTGKGKNVNKTNTKEEAITLKYNEISRYPGKVNEYLAILNGQKKETAPKEKTNTNEPTVNQGAIGTFYYVVESGKGNAMIASLFGVSQDDIEKANKDLHSTRGSKGYFYPNDKIVIPNPLRILIN